MRNIEDREENTGKTRKPINNNNENDVRLAHSLFKEGGSGTPTYGRDTIRNGIDTRFHHDNGIA